MLEKIAIFSDVHANLTALEAVMKDIEERGINKIICLGDIVYKGVSPAETIDLIKEKCDIVLKGNCDEQMGSQSALTHEYWTRLKIGEERARYLAELPICYEFYLSGHLVRLFHASPVSLDALYNPMYSNKNSKNENREIDSPDIMFQNTEFIGKKTNDKVPDIIGYGHIHTPHIVRFKNKMLFNTGSVGMPAEMLNKSQIEYTSKFSSMASYTILEGEYGQTELKTLGIQLIRVPYNINTEISRIQNSDTPNKETLIRKLKTAEP